MTRLISMITLLLLPIGLSAQWTHLSGPYGNQVWGLAGDEHQLLIGSSNGLYLDSLSASTWSPLDSALAGRGIASICINGETVVAGTFSNTVFISTNHGATWDSSSLGVPDLLLRAIACAGKFIFAGGYTLGTYPGGLYRTSDNGSSWIALDSDLTSSGIFSIAVLNSDIFIATQRGVFYSNDTGDHWTPRNAGLSNLRVGLIKVFNGQLLALNYVPMDPLEGEAGGIYLSSDQGQSWNPILVTWGIDGPSNFEVRETSIFAAFDTNIVLSTNDGTTWTTVGQGLPRKSVYSLEIAGSDLFAAVEDSGLYRRPLDEMTMRVEESPSTRPHGFELAQNYPNPFNPTTNFTFAIPAFGHVDLEIYSIIGQKIATLVSGDFAAGVYTWRWSPTGLSSGVYVCRLRAGQFARSIRIVLQK